MCAVFWRACSMSRKFRMLCCSASAASCSLCRRRCTHTQERERRQTHRQTERQTDRQTHVYSLQRFFSLPPFPLHHPLSLRLPTCAFTHQTTTQTHSASLSPSPSLSLSRARSPTPQGEQVGLRFYGLGFRVQDLGSRV